MSIRNIILLLLMCVLFCLNGCSSPNGNPSTIFDISWRLNSFIDSNGVFNKAADSPDSIMRLIENTESVLGSINCNGVYGYSVEQTSIIFRKLPAIGPACSMPNADQSEAFQRQLLAIERSFLNEVVFSFDEGDLILIDIEGASLRFSEI